MENELSNAIKYGVFEGIKSFFSAPSGWIIIAFVFIAFIAKTINDKKKAEKKKAAKEADMRKQAQYIKEEFDKDKK